MKDVSEILAKRLKRLEAPFSRDWLSDFSSFMELVRVNPSTIKILELIDEQKENAHVSLSQNLGELLKEGARCLKAIQKTIGRKHEASHSIDELLKTKIDFEELENPFFELESVYRKYYASFVSLLRILAQEDTNAFLSKYCTINCIKLQDNGHLNIDLTFSPYLQKCNQDIEILSGQRASSVWGKWDTILKWAEWTKNGISLTNDAFEHNISNLFRGLKISETLQGCGLFFLERLASMQTITTDSKIGLKALELFLDHDDQYWIIAHLSGEKSERYEFFIKRLQRGARAYALLKLLLDAEEYSTIEFFPLSHTLGELKIKKELKKLFFPSDKFAGSIVRLNEIDRPINASEILAHLSSIKNSKKNHPSFNTPHYFKTSSYFG